MTYNTCQGCHQSLRIRQDKNFPRHRVPREQTKAKRLPVCPGSETSPAEPVRYWGRK